MSSWFHRAIAAGCCCGLAVLVTPKPARAVPIFNPGFEHPIVDRATGYITEPSAADQGAGAKDTAWVFTGSAGVAVQGGSMGRVTVPPAPQGSQVGFVDQGGQFSQVLSFPADGEYVLSFQEGGTGIFTVMLDDTVIVPSHGFLVTDQFDLRTAPFTTTAGPHTLRFVDTDPREIAGPLPAFIDSVAITPEPAATAVLALGATLLLRRRR